MEVLKILGKYYRDNKWVCGEDYESLEWYDTTIVKPTEEELELLQERLIVDEMRDKRNQLLKDSDFRAIPDYVLDKALWIIYRQKLRELPATWVDGMKFPTPP